MRVTLIDKTIDHPNRYQSDWTTALECIDVSRYLPFSLGMAFKHMWRYINDGDAEESENLLDKALWYLKDWEEHNYDFNFTPAKAVMEAYFPPSYNVEYSLKEMAMIFIAKGCIASAVENVIKIKRGDDE